MAKKIEGWAWPDTGEKYEGRTGFPIYNDRFSTALVKATLVIGDERVFTESEVRDMINAMAEACDLAPVHYKVVGEHGIVLDPA